MATSTAPYTDLGLSPGADEAAIRQAFRRLAFELHPDRNPDPEAVGAFVRVRAAYEALLAPAHRDVVEAEEVVEEVMRAAARAARSRTRPEHGPAPLRFALEAARPGLPAAVAARVATGLAGCAAVAVGLAALAGPAAVALAGVLGLAALGVWLTRRRPSELHVYGDGFADDRWPEAGRIGWADIRALDPDHGARLLDLALSPPVAARLARLDGPPRGVLVWQGSQPFYRLPLGDRLDKGLVAISARTGLSAR